MENLQRMLMNCLLLAIAASLALVGAETPSNPFTATWKVDPGNCKLGAIRPDPNRDVFRISLTGDEYRQTYQDGRTLTFQVDGEPHKSGASTFASITGSDEYMARRVDSRTIELTTKRKGTVVGRMRRQVSADGSLLTFTIEGTSIAGKDVGGVCVYHRQ
jgi:hypothetical protein